MFKYLTKIALVATLWIGGHAAHAQMFGWTATVKATDPANLSYHEETVTAPTYVGCEQARLFVITNTFATFVIHDYGVCSPIAVRLPEKLIIPELIKWPSPWPWPWPPVCLSCPFLVEDLIDIIYPPEQAKQVYELMDKYDINTYNKELQQLQERFDLQGFEQEMYKLESAGRLEGPQR